MILRKPYAFLIKHFKLIHLILTILLAFVLYKTNNLLTFFNQYLSSGKYQVIDNLTNNYIGILLYLIIIFIIGISAVIFWLMYKKDKPIKYYLILIIYYISLIIGLIFISIQLDNIAFNKIDVLLLNVSRDILLVLYIIQIPFLIVSIIRTVGFNIKKFNFQRDLMELEISEQDNEEFELDVDIDSDDVKARFRRRRRLIKYVLKENKITLIVLFGIFLIISGIILHNTVYLKNLVHKENKKINSNGLELTVIDSYQTDKNLFGEDISKDKYSYTIARVKVRNTSNSDRQIPIKAFTLKVGDNRYKSSIKEKDDFLPFGYTNSNIKLSINEESIFIVIFKINKEDLNKSKIMEYAGSYKMKGNERIYNVDKFNLKPKTYNKQKKIKSVNIEEKLSFKESILKNSNIVINSYEIEDRFTYSYQQCIDDCYTFNDYIIPKYNTKYRMSVMKLDLNIKIDENIYNNKLKEELIPSLGHLRYVINGKEYNQKFVIYDITPSSVNDYKYFEVKSDIKKAEKIYLDFIILDKVYTYVLKEA